MQPKILTLSYSSHQSQPTRHAFHHTTYNNAITPANTPTAPAATTTTAFLPAPFLLLGFGGLGGVVPVPLPLPVAVAFTLSVEFAELLGMPLVGNALFAAAAVEDVFRIIVSEEADAMAASPDATARGATSVSARLASSTRRVLARGWSVPGRAVMKAGRGAVVAVRMAAK